MSVKLRGKVYHCKFQFNGRTIRCTTRQTKKAAAQKWERDYRAQLERDAEAIQFDRPLRRTFGQALAMWIEMGAPESMMSHARMVREHMETVELSQAVPASAEMVKAMLADGLSPCTINRRLAVIRRVLNIAFKTLKWLREPEGQRIELLSEAGTERFVFLTPEQVTLFVKALGDWDAIRSTLLAAYTGIRKGRIRTLQPHNWVKPNIIFGSHETKNGKPLAVPLVEDLHYLMDELPFNLTDWDIRQHWDRARIEVEMPWVRFHDLRHTFASWLVLNPEIPLTVVRDIMGHSSLAVTSKYAHLRTGALQDAILTLAGHKNGHSASARPAQDDHVSD